MKTLTGIPGFPVASFLFVLLALFGCGSEENRTATEREPADTGGASVEEAAVEETSAPEETTMMEKTSPGEEEETAQVEETTGEPAEYTEIPEGDDTVYGDAPDPAFDFIIPDLIANSSGEIMLPAELPDELQNVAIEGTGPADANTKIPEWGVVFTDYEQETTFDLPARVNRKGGIKSAPAPAGYEYTVPEGFEASTYETLTLSDGTQAALAYVAPTGLSNTAPHWEGGFLRGSTVFTYDIFDADVSYEEAQAFVGSMVEVLNDEYGGTLPESSPPADTASPSQEEMSSGEPLDTFVNDYWVAVGQCDWATTYSYLSASGQAEFTEEEWIYAQESRENETPTCSGSGVFSAEIIPGGYGAGEGGTVDVTLYCGDGTEVLIPGFGVAVNVVDDMGAYERVLTPENVADVRGYL